MPNNKFNTVVLITLFLLTGCGLKGPLYVTDKSRPMSVQNKSAQSETIASPAIMASGDSH